MTPNDTATAKERPLFIPLNTEYYQDFKKGHKTKEFRVYGPRWNEKVCRVGRQVTLSKGYGKKDRITRTIMGFRKVNAHSLGITAKMSIVSCYKTLDLLIAEIEIK